MQLWMWVEKCHADEGARVFEVEWEAEPANWSGEESPGPDDMIHYSRSFPNVVAARRYARNIRKRTAYGYARVREYVAQQDEYAPRGIGEWEPVGETEYVD